LLRLDPARPNAMISCDWSFWKPTLKAHVKCFQTKTALCHWRLRSYHVLSSKHWLTCCNRFSRFPTLN
jgi:hypothetical protein